MFSIKISPYNVETLSKHSQISNLNFDLYGQYTTATKENGPHSSDIAKELKKEEEAEDRNLRTKDTTLKMIVVDKKTIRMRKKLKTKSTKTGIEHRT